MTKSTPAAEPAEGAPLTESFESIVEGRRAYVAPVDAPDPEAEPIADPAADD